MHNGNNIILADNGSTIEMPIGLNFLMMPDKDTNCSEHCCRWWFVKLANLSIENTLMLLHILLKLSFAITRGHNTSFSPNI